MILTFALLLSVDKLQSSERVDPNIDECKWNKYTVIRTTVGHNDNDNNASSKSSSIELRNDNTDGSNTNNTVTSITNNDDDDNTDNSNAGSDNKRLSVGGGAKVSSRRPARSSKQY
jgi:hypothetical protein